MSVLGNVGIWREEKANSILTLLCLLDAIFVLRSLCVSAINYDPRDSNSPFLPLASSPGLPPYPLPPTWPLFRLKQRKAKTSWAAFMLFFFKLLRLNPVEVFFLCIFMFSFHCLSRVHLLCVQLCARGKEGVMGDDRGGGSVDNRKGKE